MGTRNIAVELCAIVGWFLEKDLKENQQLIGLINWFEDESIGEEAKKALEDMRKEDDGK